MFEYHSFENRNIFERTEFERTYETYLYSHERFFSFETNFKRTTDEFRKNVIRSNDLSRNGAHQKNIFFFKQPKSLKTRNYLGFDSDIEIGNYNKNQNKFSIGKNTIFFDVKVTL